MNWQLAAAASGIAGAAALTSAAELLGRRAIGRRSRGLRPRLVGTGGAGPAGVVGAVACIAVGRGGAAVPVAAACAAAVALARRVRERRLDRLVERSLPALAGSVAAGLAAGLAPAEALASACRHREDPLGLATARACARVEAGVPLERSLGELAGGFRSGRLSGMCTAIAVASRRGTDATGPVRAIAAAARSADLLARRERAARAAPAIQLVIALGMVPSVLLLVAAAALATATG